MIRRQLVAAAIAGLMMLALGALLVLVGCGSRSDSYRVRVTVEVETPQGVRTGSSVLEVRAARTFALLPQEAKAEVALAGEAIAIDLPNEKTLFAVLRTQSDERSLQYGITATLDPSFRGGAEGYLSSVPALGRPEMIGRSAVLPPEFYPLLVRFGDPNDPASVEQVDPDGLDAAFGAGTRLRRIVVEITSDPITADIERRLPWLPSYAVDRRVLSGSTSIAQLGDNVRDYLGAGEFSSEVGR